MKKAVWLILDIVPTAMHVPIVYYSKGSDGEIIKVDSSLLAKIIKEAVDVFEYRVININAGTTNEKQSRSVLSFHREMGNLHRSSCFFYVINKDFW